MNPPDSKKYLTIRYLLHMTTNSVYPKNILPGAEPIEIPGNDVGFLFIHGFTGAPYEGKELARHLHSELGLTISVPLLPGHGTSPENLKGIRWSDWVEFVQNEYHSLKKQCSHIIVCGLSMGGTLALNLAAHHPVDAVISLAGAVFLKDWRLFLLPIARYLIPYNYKSKGPDIRLKELKTCVPTYRKYPVKSVDQLLTLMRHTKERLKYITAPALLIHSKKDRTVPFENLEFIFNHISSEKKEKLILENSYHIVSIDVEKNQVFKKVNEFISRLFPEKIASR
ncbi:MAG: alpha/beta fold hydrolase [Calditrichia bacterium]